LRKLQKDLRETILSNNVLRGRVYSLSETTATKEEAQRKENQANVVMEKAYLKLLAQKKKKAKAAQ